jgi:hypothetical protein
MASMDRWVGIPKRSMCLHVMLDEPGPDTNFKSLNRIQEQESKLSIEYIELPDLVDRSSGGEATFAVELVLPEVPPVRTQPIVAYISDSLFDDVPVSFKAEALKVAGELGER